MHALHGLSNCADVAQGKSQIDFALGSTGRSYVVGFGAKPPVSPFQKVRRPCCPLAGAGRKDVQCQHVATWLQDAWNSWLNYRPGKMSAAQIRAQFLTSPQPNRSACIGAGLHLHACVALCPL
jgi:hypothetical protein